MSDIMNLIEYLKKEEKVYIQTHNFPDHDSIASAYGLQMLLKEYDVKADIIFEGFIQRESLNKMISLLEIEVHNYSDFNLTQEDKIIIVDGCKGNSNVNDLIGDEIAVIDHHEVNKPESVRFVDIRSDYGACSTIIFSYYSELGVKIPKNVATALIIGINMDTSLLTRGVSQIDVEAYPDLYESANMPLVNSLLRNYIQTKDLGFYKQLVNNIIIKDSFAFYYFPEGCNQNLLGVLGDFLLSIDEVDYVALCAKNSEVINFSIRSENKKLNAAKTIQHVLEGIGFGGGHSEMAGGVIKDISKFDEQTIFDRFYSCLSK